MMSTKKNKKRVLASSSDSDDEENPNPNLTPTKATEQICPRSSQRLKRKSQRSSFVLPSRNKVWDTIPSESSSKKEISPRKTVNNFTKVYNSYNYDDYEDTSHDDSEGFSTDSSEGSHSEEDSSKKMKSGRVKNYRRRIKLCSSSDEEKSSTNNNKESVDRKCDQLKSEVRQSTDEQDKLVAPVDIGGESATLNNVDDCNVVDDNSGDEGISPMKRRRTTSILESDSKSESESESSDVSGTSESSHDESESDVCNDSRSSKFKRKRNELFQKFNDVQKVRKAAQKTLVPN